MTGRETMDEWKIVRDRSHLSHGCCSRVKGPELFAVLELPACVRRDYCPICFEEQRRKQVAEGARAAVFWKVRRKEGKRTPQLDLGMLRHLFDRLGEEEGERPAALRYFVALLLLRKRMLKLVDATTPEQEAADLVLIDPKRPEMEPVALFAPPLEDGGLDGIKDELLALADGAEPTEEEAG